MTWLQPVRQVLLHLTSPTVQAGVMT